VPNTDTVAAPRRASARVAALPAPNSATRRRPAPALPGFLPSPRSLVACIVLVALAIGAYAVARETSVFAVRTIDVRGGSPQLREQVRRALEPVVGRSLVRVDNGVIDRRLASIAGVLRVRFDRAFPHTLRVIVTPERPVVLLRRGKDGWVVSARGRVLRQVKNVRVSTLPRVWAPKDTTIQVGGHLAPAGGGRAASLVAPLASTGFPAHVRLVRATDHELTLVLASGLEVRFGDGRDLRLKLAVARRLLLLLGSGTTATYVDVSVPERPVVGGVNPQVTGTG
jgi:cell division protein FtsQ